MENLDLQWSTHHAWSSSHQSSYLDEQHGTQHDFVSGTVPRAQSLSILVNLVTLLRLRSKLTLLLFNFKTLPQQSLIMLVEPLKRSPSGSGPLNLLDFASTSWDYFFTMNHDSGKYMFTTTFQSYLRDLIAFVMELSEKSRFINVSENNIVVNTQNELKLVDVSSKYSSVTESLLSIQTMVAHLVNKAKQEKSYSFVYEVGDFIVAPIDHHSPETMAKHPALLDNKEKYIFMSSVQQCMKHWGLIVEDLDSLHSWITKVSKFEHLEKVLNFNLPASSPVSTNNAASLLTLVRSMEENINDYVKPSLATHSEHSPLATHKKGRRIYKNSDIARIIDFLFPEFICWIHRQNLYRILYAAG